VFGSIEDRRNRSKTLLKVEQRLEIIIQAINRSGEGKEAALILIAQAIPCIMHLENPVGEKLITVLLAIAAEIYREKKTTQQQLIPDLPTIYRPLSILESWEVCIIQSIGKSH
jgi:hypothetical protein